MSKKDFNLVLLFSLISVVFGLSWIVTLYFFKVGVFDLSYQGVLFVAIVYAALMLYYFKKARIEFLFSHAMVMSMILNFIFSFFISLALYVLLGAYEDAFLSISTLVKIDDMVLRKEEYLKIVSVENLELSIQALKLTKPFDVAFDFFTKFSIIGLLYSLVLSLIFKKKNEAGN